MAVGKAKTEWELIHPDTRKGKYCRSQSKNETISDGESLMLLQNHQDISGFVKKNYKVLGISERSLYRRVRFYNAIINNIFDEKTLNSFKNEEISYSQLLNKLRKLENKRKIRNNLEAAKVFQSRSNSSFINEKKKEPERSISDSSTEKVKKGKLKNKLSQKINDKFRSPENSKLKIISNEKGTFFTEVGEDKDSKHNVTIKNDKQNKKKPTFLEEVSFDKAFTPKLESAINEEIHKESVEIEDDLKSIPKETIYVCPHCKKDVIISENNLNGQVIKSLLPIHFK